MTLGVRKDKSGAILFCTSAVEAQQKRAEALRKKADRKKLGRLEQAIALLARELPASKRELIERLLQGE